MNDKPPYLTLVDPQSTRDHDDEFLPLPHYNWSERPPTLALTHDEAATAIYLDHGDLEAAAVRLKVPLIRLTRLLRQSPRLKTILQESLEQVLARAVHTPIQTLFDPTSNQRAKEWASNLVLKSRLAQDHPLAPAPPGAAASLTVNPISRSVTFRWRTDADDQGVPSEDQGDAG
jgi:hypothetical protein